jgi:Flp pilus assembly pilin Flp
MLYKKNKQSRLLFSMIISESGATAFEYAFIVGMLSLLIVLSLQNLGPVITAFTEALNISLSKADVPQSY